MTSTTIPTTTTGGLRLAGVRVRAGTVTVVSGLTLHAPAGTSLAVTGPSRSGKSTLLRALAGRGRLEAGQVLLDDRPVTADRVGVADQQHHLLGGLTAAENVAVRALSQGAVRAQEWSGIEQLLRDLGLPPSAWHNLTEQLSGGQQQRVAVARALHTGPPLVCLDDPVSELDAASADLVWAALSAALSAGAVLVVATPDPDQAARCDQVLQLAAPAEEAGAAAAGSVGRAGDPLP